MIDFGKWAFDNKKLVYFLVAVLFVGGLYSAYDMSKLEDPEIKVKMAMVIATRPGASAHEMEMEITEPLEKNIRTIGEVDCESIGYGKRIAGRFIRQRAGRYNHGHRFGLATGRGRWLHATRITGHIYPRNGHADGKR